MKCINCGTEFYEDWRKDKGKRNKTSCRYCSRACSNTRIHSEETKLKISISIKTSGLWKKGQEVFLEKAKNRRVYKICPCCKNIFNVPLCYSKKIYCSKACYNKDSKHIFRKVTTGGYRKGSGRSKSGYYKGIYCGSTYELAWVIYQLDNNIPFSRFEKELSAPFTKRKYIPDFLQKGNIIEIKGYERDSSVDEKNKIAEYNGYYVIVKRKENLQEEFDYVESIYKISKDKIYYLYDNYKPKFSYICEYCKKEFFRNKQIKTEHGFCSRSCAGRFVGAKRPIDFFEKE